MRAATWLSLWWGRLPARLGLSLPLILLACGDAPPPVAEPPLPSGFLEAGMLARNGRIAEALAAYRTLADSATRSADTVGLWRARLREADALRILGRMDSARATLDLAEGLVSDDAGQRAETAIVRSQLLEKAGDLEQALTVAIEARELARRAASPRLELNALNAMGTAYSLQGRYREALTADSGALALRRQLGDPPAEIARGLNEVGIGYRHLGRHSDAAQAYEEALELNRDGGNELVRAMLLYNLSNVRAAGGDVNESIRLLAASLAEAEALEHPQGIALNHHALAERYLAAGNLRAARPHAEKALQANRGGGFVYGQILGLISLARIELLSDAPDAAARAAEEALVLADRGGFAKERAILRALAGRAALLRDQPDAALRWTGEAVALADSVRDPETELETLHAHALVLEGVGQDDQAASTYANALDLLESWRGRLELGDLRMGVADDRLAIYEGALRLHVGRGEAEAAFEVAERARARMLLELMARRDGVADPTSATDALRQRLREAHHARVSARAGDADALQARVETLAAELEAAEARDRQTDPVVASARYPRPARIPELRETLLAHPGQALLAFFWGDEEVFAWWITDRSTRVARLGRADSLAPLVSFLRSAIEQPGPVDWKDPAARAYRALLEPLAPGGHQDVLVLADGPLTLLPIEVLVDASGAPWSRGRRVRYGPSASVLLALHNVDVGTTWPREVLVVGNPTLHPPAPEVDLATRGDQDLPALPYAADEARDIARLFRSDGADLLLGRRATLQRWLALGPHRYRYLHFAAHAVIDDRRADQTRILLADGTLDLPAIRSLDLQAQLVTLSACETALGRRVRGEGVIGLPHAFLSAGARAVVVSLWPVRDQPAAEFMAGFYRGIRDGLDPAAALVAIRARYRADPATAHPAAWAGFILIGGLATPDDSPSLARHP